MQALGLAADVTDADALDAATTATLPPIGAVVNGFLVTHRVAPGTAERGFGRNFFLSSVAAERGGGVFGGVAYPSAKAALLGWPAPRPARTWLPVHPPHRSCVARRFGSEAPLGSLRRI
ncbi:hypothetical protein [Streptomyces scabiei]|uniref:hypothetical protein n=1 Tax=Streptomyces scabiei TaxID=1930 RepID=UPI0029A75993|nr:hypothetical protein [Streptomyces scabiei]MDX3524287.1 hypothetical protein [Streptomyces scabiei]